MKFHMYAKFNVRIASNEKTSKFPGWRRHSPEIVIYNFNPNEYSTWMCFNVKSLGAFDEQNHK